MGGLDGFSEVMNMGETMKNSILGDTGIGAMAPYMGDISRMEEGLEKGIQSLGGIQNNVQYNWQKWFNDELSTKYGKNYKKFLSLEEQANIMKAYNNPGVKKPIYNNETNEFNQKPSKPELTRNHFNFAELNKKFATDSILIESLKHKKPNNNNIDKFFC